MPSSKGAVEAVEAGSGPMTPVLDILINREMLSEQIRVDKRDNKNRISISMLPFRQLGLRGETFDTTNVPAAVVLAVEYGYSAGYLELAQLCVQWLRPRK